jgi:RNA polymerase sigma factor (sigma-70 family)
MSTERSSVPIETLLTHRPWVRRLALSLARDEASAADLEQRTWLAALLHPPHGRGSVRAWLGRVLRNLARNAHRADGRRHAYESAARRLGSARSTAELVADAEIHRRLVGAVLDLDEPYRSTVLLRFYEDLPPREVARRLGAPVETVRTRVRRALDLIRARLAPDGRRETWLAALTPLVGLRFETGGAAAGSAGTALAGVSGGAIMSGKSTGTVVAAVVLGLLAGWVGGTLSTPRVPPGPDPALADLGRRIAALEAGQGDLVAPELATEPLSGREADLERRLAVLEGKLVAASGSDAAPDPERPEAERRRFTGMTDAQILVEAERLMWVAIRSQKKRDAERALRACEAALERGLTVDQRASALVLRGRCHNLRGDGESAGASYREALGAIDPSSKTWRTAAHGLAFVAVGRKDWRTASAWFLRIADQPDTPRARPGRIPQHGRGLHPRLGGEGARSSRVHAGHRGVRGRRRRPRAEVRRREPGGDRTTRPRRTLILRPASPRRASPGPSPLRVIPVPPASDCSRTSITTRPRIFL